MNEHTKWSEFVGEIYTQILFWCFGIIYYLLFRIIFILFFINQIDAHSTWVDIYKTFLMGFRFDSAVTAYFILLPFLFTLILAPFDKLRIAILIRKIFQNLFIISTTIICVVTINYFREYNDQFNHFLFVGLYDDQKAVFETIVADFNPVINLITILIIILISSYIFRNFEKGRQIVGYLQKIKNTPYRILLVSIIIALFIGSIRGSFGNRPVMRKWSSVSRDPFLNKTIINPIRSLNYAISDFNKFNKIDGDNPFGQVGSHINDVGENTVTATISKKSEGPTIQRPKHIFLIIVESLDSWPLLSKYSEFNVVPNLKHYSKNGISFPNFLPSSNSTMNSFGAIITGIPYSGINISKIGAINASYPSSMFTQFEKLGYVTNFYYGGFMSWQNIGNFVNNQGADNLYSAADAGGKTESGVWGIDDDMLFRLVLDTIDDNSNSLNIILTTSYHPPYTIDIYGRGFSYKSKDDLPLKAQSQYKGAMSILALGHLWYSDKAIGDFVSEIITKYPNSIFCFTGDHYGRRFINSYPNLLETSEVPFIIYGGDIEPKINYTPGSHIDILPTLIEMIAPKNFDYYAFGNSLNLNQEDKIGIGYQKIISKNEIQFFPESSIIQTLDLNNMVTSFTKNSEYMPKYNKLLSLSWHYTVRGDSINVD
ncbi:LTA synthase family protein [Candidatus Neomarinimicrobiota bacterium]